MLKQKGDDDVSSGKEAGRAAGDRPKLVRPSVLLLTTFLDDVLEHDLPLT
jgi:hypothetical protein